MSEFTSCIMRDKMDFDPLEWNNIVFWARPSLRSKITKAKTYSKFELYSLKGGYTYKLIETNPFKNTHPSGWDLWLCNFDREQNPIKLSDMIALKNVDFKELFCFMTILFTEDNKDSIQDDSGILPVEQVEEIKQKCKSLLQKLPEWLDPMIKSTDQWVTDRNNGTHDKIMRKLKEK